MPEIFAGSDRKLTFTHFIFPIDRLSHSQNMLSLFRGIID